LLYVPLSLRSDRSLRIGRRLLARVTPVADGVEVRSELVPAASGAPALRLVVYERSGRARPSGALLWIHGGGLVSGVPEQDHALCSRLAAELGIVVVSVDYRLAPEHPLPAGLEDCHAALSWLHAHADGLGVDRARVSVGGGSAGGGLAACLAQMAQDRGGPPVLSQVLKYPMLDDRTALRTGGETLLWTRVSNCYAWSAYLGHPVGPDEPRPYASAARRADLRGLPPAWIGVGDIDLFHAECVDYASRLRASGVPCELHVVPGMYHGADVVVPAAQSMRGFVERMTGALRSALSVPPG